MNVEIGTVGRAIPFLGILVSNFRCWFFAVYTAKKFEFIYPQKGIARPQPLLHVNVSVRDLYITSFGPPIVLQQNRQTDQGKIKIAHRHINVGIGTVAAQSLFWEYLFRIFGTVSLQCTL
jgi:hypothetical protein